jgi:osmotically-inducible protein OsmY
MPDVVEEELNRLLAKALAGDPATAGYNVHARAADGGVTVTGMVQSWTEKQLVLRVVRGVRGVRRLETDDLIIQWGGCGPVWRSLIISFPGYCWP